QLIIPPPSNFQNTPDPDDFPLRNNPFCRFIAIKRFGLRLHITLKHPADRPLSSRNAPPLSDSSSFPPTSLEDNITCDICSTKCRTMKELLVHKQSVHHISVNKQEKSSLLDIQWKIRHPTPISEDVILTQEDLTNMDLLISELGNSLQISKVEFTSSICLQRIAKKPSSHPCLKKFFSHSINDSSFCGGKWNSSICPFFATSKIGLDLHSRIHKRQALSSMGPSDITSSNTSRQDQDISLIDIPEPSLLNLFIEPLDTLNDEDLDEQFRLLEKIHEDFISTIQDYFHLKTSSSSEESTGGNPSVPTKSLVDETQAIQKAFSWNRRKCMTTSTLPGKKIHKHHNKIEIWSTLRH
ncbi:hypothetical protein NPIL_24521, partial [Nephila pilipes]